MQSNDYQQECLRSEPGLEAYWQAHQRLHSRQMMRLLHCAMGMMTECGEFMDMLKKHIFYGKPLDEVNLAEEIGDAAWYQSIGADALEKRLEEIFEKNIQKLRTRYPDKFSADDALTRDLAAERRILEK